MLLAAMAAVSCPAQVEREIVALERHAMDGWLKGDSGPALALCDSEITYFHTVTDGRIDGAAAVKSLFESYGGRALFDSYEIAAPKVQLAGDAAVLTYQLVTHNGETTRRWNVTQVYQRKKEGWRVVHSHFSMNRPPLS